ncbi:L,D-transpeptidase [Microbacterium sp. NPDC076911]|uniref:L,D-transpeptidase n=1 Tax=Microbacterium sp. NPDC076911 TaxID=3154958 RepID=UPI0034409FA4
MTTPDEMTAAPRRWPWIAAAGALAAIAVVVFSMWMLRPAETAASTPIATPTATAMPTATPTPTPTPTPTGFPANTATYDVTTLEQVSVFSVLEKLPVDDEPAASFVGETALALGVGAPVFADPEGEPVAYVPREFPYDGTLLPVIERQTNWVKVLLTGRQAIPSTGDPAQVSGWLRVQDVELAPNDTVVKVDISERTLDIVTDGEAQRIANDFAWGTDATPTPLGRTFIMTTRVVEEFWYTRGHPIVYLAVQSPTLDGFGGADVAITAFHYHDQRSGAISNGCIRLDADAIDTLAELPIGTPVVIEQ